MIKLVFDFVTFLHTWVQIHSTLAFQVENANSLLHEEEFLGSMIFHETQQMPTQYVQMDAEQQSGIYFLYESRHPVYNCITYQ